LVLRPKGRVEVADHITLRSNGSLTDLRASWRVVELWNVPASELLATGEPGLMPWLPLTRLDGPVPAILGECRRIIDERPRPEEHDNLLAITQVLMNLVYDDAALYAIFGGKEAMIESPMLNELVAEQVAKKLDEKFAERVSEQVAERLQMAVLGLLEKRFESVPLDLVQQVKEVTNADQLLQLNNRAAVCPDLETFRQHLGA
jgi:hypothetical protein